MALIKIMILKLYMYTHMTFIKNILKTKTKKTKKTKKRRKKERKRDIHEEINDNN